MVDAWRSWNKEAVTLSEAKTVNYLGQASVMQGCRSRPDSVSKTAGYLGGTDKDPDRTEFRVAQIRTGSDS